MAAEDMAEEAVRVATLRDSLLRQLQASAPHINGTMAHRLPGNLNVSFEGVDGDALLSSVPEIAVSAGSACSSGSDSSYVLEALGLPPALLQCSVRFGLGRSNTQAEIDRAAAEVAAAVRQLRALSPVL
jgi:cysteine desulfurase